MKSLKILSISEQYINQQHEALYENRKQISILIAYQIILKIYNTSGES